MRLWVVLVLLGALVAGCGDDGDGSQTPPSELAVPWIDPDGDPPIVGSLTVNPADKTLFMATNTGLFRVPEGASEPEKLTGRLETPDGVGEVSEALVVRFTGPDTLLGSGHPAAGIEMPRSGRTCGRRAGGPPAATTPAGRAARGRGATAARGRGPVRHFGRGRRRRSPRVTTTRTTTSRTSTTTSSSDSRASYCEKSSTTS